MNVMLWIALGILALGVVIFIVTAMTQQAEVGAMIFIPVLIIAVVIGFVGIMPEWRLHRASIEKRILVEQARAEADSAVEYKRAEVTRAEGVAEANIIIAGSIDEQYLRYLFVNNLGNTSNQIIYVPTEANLPILEALRHLPDRSGE